MAKPVPDPQVEDVLSSVRRLVSDELPRNQRPSLPEGPGALVLTDAQRIEANAAVRIAGRSLQERIAEMEAAVRKTANDDDFEPDGSEDQSQHRPDRIVYTRPPTSEESDKMRRNTLRLSQIALIDTGDDEEDPDKDSDVQMEFRRERSEESDTKDVEAPMAEDVKETLTAAEVHVFTSPDAEIARIEARLNGEPEPERVTKSAPTASAPSNDEAIAFFTEDAAEPVSTEREGGAPSAPQKAEHKDVLELHPDAADAAFDADLKAALESVEREAEPEKPAIDETPHSESAPSETAETEIAEAAIAATVTDAFVDLDEDTLRPLVANLIREELQGELGERITRNVRKLVRREILRALAARDAE